MSILDQKISARRILGMVAGVVIIGIGIAVFKFSHLGNDSISALNLRLAELAGLPFSIENVLMNLFFVCAAADLGAAVHWLGTIINSFLHRLHCHLHEQCDDGGLRLCRHPARPAVLGGCRRVGRCLRVVRCTRQRIWALRPMTRFR